MVNRWEHQVDMYIIDSQDPSATVHKFDNLFKYRLLKRHYTAFTSRTKRFDDS